MEQREEGVSRTCRATLSPYQGIEAQTLRLQLRGSRDLIDAAKVANKIGYNIHNVYQSVRSSL